MYVSRLGLLGRSSLRLQKVARAALSPRRHARLAAAMRQAQQDGVYRHCDSSFWKYLDNYLVRGLSVSERASIIERHFRFLDDRLPPGASRSTWIDGATFWSAEAASGRSYKIIAGQVVRAPCEGEAEFTLLVDNTLLATLTFAIGPGELFGLRDADVLVIGGVQGIYGGRGNNRIAAKDHGEIAPTAMLLLAAKAFAEAFGIHHIVGVSNQAHVEQGRDGLVLKYNYDRQWVEAGAIALSSGLFVMRAADRAGRARQHLSRAHRARSRRKANLKSSLQAAMRGRLEELFAGATAVTVAAPKRRIDWRLDPATSPRVPLVSAMGHRPRQ